MQILSRDAVRVAELEAIYSANSDRADLAREAVHALGVLDSVYAWRALWLLRRAAVDETISSSLLARVVEGVGGCEHWAARLVACQLFAAAPCPATAREELFPFLQRCLTDRRVIIRAWALTALLHFVHDRRYCGAVGRALRQARRDPAKAMQARLRRIAAQRGGRPDRREL